MDRTVPAQQLCSWMEGAGNNPAASRAASLLTWLHLPLGKCFPAGSWSGYVRHWNAFTWVLKDKELLVPTWGIWIGLFFFPSLFLISRELWVAAQAEKFRPVPKSVNLNFATLQGSITFRDPSPIEMGKEASLAPHLLDRENLHILG